MQVLAQHARLRLTFFNGFGYTAINASICHTIMSIEQENAADKAPQTKPQTILIWILCGCILALSILCIQQNRTIEMIIEEAKPPTLVTIQGRVVILDENGETIPFQPTEIQAISLYPPGRFRSEERRRPNLSVGAVVGALDVFDKLGLFSGKIPNFPAALLFQTKDGKYAAIIDITPDEPLTDLVVRLRPRYTITGRLFSGHTGDLLDNRQVHLESNRTSEFSTGFGPRTARWRIFHFARTRTDSEGVFTIEGVIPGTEYHLYGNKSIHTMGGETIYGYFGITLDMPILQPEQYREPFCLGDLSFLMVHGAVVYPGCEDSGFCDCLNRECH